MSNDVYGYVEPRSTGVTSAIGLLLLRSDEVYGLPENLAPRDCFTCFRITDRPGASTASYLADMVDYALDAEIGMPNTGLARLKLVVDWIREVVCSTDVAAMVIVASDDNEVEEAVDLDLKDVRSRLESDFVEYAPPNRAYIIRRVEPGHVDPAKNRRLGPQD